MRSRVIQVLHEGLEFTAFGVGFRVSSLSFTENPQRPNTISVSAGLGGRHENYDFDVPYKGSAGMTTAMSGAEPDPNCVGSVPGGAASTSSKTYTTVSQLASKAGDLFAGPLMKVFYGKDDTGGTNFISEAQKHVRIYQSFLFYSNPSAVESRNLYGVGYHALTPSQIKSEIQVTIAGRTRKTLVDLGQAFHHEELLPVEASASLGFPFPPSPVTPIAPGPENQGVYPWVKSYDPPHKLEGKFSEVEDTNSEDTQANSEYQKPNWKARKPVRKVIKTPEEDPSIPPAGTGRLKDISLAFDNSGTEPKTQKIEILEDDLPVESTEVSYGFAFLGTDMFSGEELVGAAPGCWKQTRKTTTVHHYDTDANGPSRNTGYYLGSDTKGTQLVRYIAETSSLETTKLDPSDEIEGELLNCYKYFEQPIVGAERYYLESKQDYYKDMPPSAIELYKVCLPDGTSQYAYVDDPTWVDDFFVVTKTTRENAFSARSHPENDPPDNCMCPLTTGKESYHKEWVTVLPSNKTRTDNFNIPMPILATESAKATPQDAYLSSTTNYSSQDAQFINSLAMKVSDTNYGRPPTHTRKPPLLEKVEPESANGSGTKSADKNAIAYYVRSGVNPDARLLEGGTLSYPEAVTLQQALTAAQTDLTIDNITGGSKESFQVEFNLSMREGDIVSYYVNNEIRRRRILSISREVKIDSRSGTPILIGKSCNLSVGIERRAPMTSSSKRPIAPIATSGNKPQLITRLFIPDRWPLGEILNPELQSRRNFSV
jgi:hypothetical protein